MTGRAMGRYKRSGIECIGHMACHSHHWELFLSEPSTPFSVEMVVSQALADMGMACTVLPTLDRWPGAQTFHMLLCSLGRHGRVNRSGWFSCDCGCLRQRSCPWTSSHQTGVQQAEHILRWMTESQSSPRCSDLSLLIWFEISICPLE